MTSAVGAGREAKDAAYRASRSRWLDRVARVGLAARGFMYVVVGWLALEIAFGHHKQADRGGAVQELAGKPLGSVLLWVIGLSFVGLTLWQLSEAAFDTTRGGTRERLSSLGRAVLYGALAVTTLAFVLGASNAAAKNSNQQSKGMTARVMEHTGGRFLVALVGIALVVAGGFFVFEGVSKKFEKRLKLVEMSHRVRQVVEKLGMYGGTARGVVAGLAGVFLIIAAVTYDPGKARGVDGTLRAFAQTPLGPWLLTLVALGLVAFGAYSLCEARWRRVN